MPGRHRLKSKEESTNTLEYEQKKWGGGENSDSPASRIKVDEVPLLSDIVAFEDYLEAHGGSRAYSATVIPGSGVVHAFKQHPVSKVFVLYRGTQIWVAPLDMSFWAEAKTYTGGYNTTSIVEAGDTGNQIVTTLVSNASAFNTNAGVIYWTLVDVAGTRTVSWYKDAAHTQLTAQGSRVGNGIIVLQGAAGGAWGISGIVQVTYTGNDVDAANTLTVPIANSFGLSTAATLKPFDNDMVLFTNLQGTATSTQGIWVISLSALGIYTLNSECAGTPILPVGVQSTATPYGRRYIWTFSRITDGVTAAPGLNRVSGVLLQETGPVKTNSGLDYGEVWSASPFGYGLSIVGFLNSAITSFIYAANSQMTHISLYATTDIGVNGTDPITGNANNREAYAWLADVPLGLYSYTDSITDDVLRANFNNDLYLKSRFWIPIYDGPAGEVTPSFIFSSPSGAARIEYSQLSDKWLAGQHSAKQFFKVDGDVKALLNSGSILSAMCSNKTYSSAYNNTTLTGLFQDIEIITHFAPNDQSIGLTDVGSLAETRKGRFIGNCSDGSVREWDGLNWGDDLVDQKVATIKGPNPDGSVGAFFKGAYLLYYRNNLTDVYNTSGLRYGFGGKAGKGWCRLARASQVFPPLTAGAAVILDNNNLSHLLLLDNASGLFYRVETFESPGLTKTWKDKAATNGTGGTDIVSTLKLRERVGEHEHFTLTHQETHISLRPVDAAAGYLPGFQVAMAGYIDGAIAATETVTNIPKTGDITFGMEHKGLRLQHAFTFNTAKWRLLTVLTRDLQDDRKALGQTWAETDEAGYQRELSINLKHWLCQPYPRLNRASGRNYTLTGMGVVPAQVAGPNGKAYMLHFPDDPIGGLGTRYDQDDATFYGDFSISFWKKAYTGFTNLLKFEGLTSLYDFTIAFGSNTSMSISWPNPSVGTSIVVSSTASGFHNFWIVRTGDTISFYQNGASIGSVPGFDLGVGGLRLRINDQGSPIFLDDLRIYNAVKSAATIAYYYSNVVSGAGGKVLP